MKKKLGALVALLLAFALSACGAKVNTELKMESPTSGKRIITLVLPKLDENAQKQVHGGNDAIDKSIRRHLPKELTYSGLKKDGDKTIATFTLEFDSLETYREKIKSVFSASTQDANADPQIAITTEGLVTGVQISENYDSLALMKWLPNGLVEDRVVDEDQRGNVLENGDSKVTFDGKEHKSDGSRLHIVDVKDKGVNDLAIALEEVKDGLAISANFGYLSGTDYPKDELTKYIDSVKPDGAEVADLSGEFQGVKVAYTVANLDEANKSLVKLLGDPSFAIKETAGVQEGTGFPTRKIEAQMNCGGVCSVTNPNTTFTFTPAQGWENHGNDKIHGKNGEIDMTMNLLFSDVSVDSTLGMDGGTVVVKMSLPKDVAQRAGDAVKSIVNRADQGELESVESGDKVNYTLTLKADSNEQLNNMLGRYAPGSEFAIRENPEAGTFTDGVYFSYTNTFASTIALAEGQEVKQTFSLDGYSVDKSAESATETSTTGNFDVSGTASRMATSAWITLGVVGALVLIAVGLGVWKRKAIAAKLADMKEKRAAAAQERARAQAEAMAAQQTMAAGYPQQGQPMPGQYGQPVPAQAQPPYPGQPVPPAQPMGQPVPPMPGQPMPGQPVPPQAQPAPQQPVEGEWSENDLM
ncbi:hypothetical protein J2S49_001224 [Arcanobacterium wilhelmae]|uniref:Uncharacterized protein n=1 Tax=Arcanobacterium wilhelmae TaxID=1803177 RepID=A0ABT9NBR5_9ACTO|nr:hypothetical protein [Arcanobacterium wilhelmae]MDP9801148.1 hypothetical protein [Arcanobacterium wilhelmae]WFN90500.1 hypothetical protein P8A24_01165 [Arcanobacterium wilhelmae]